MLTFHLPLECKTVTDWHEEVKRQAYHFREKYEKSYRTIKSTVHAIRFYRNGYYIYADLQDLLNHLIKYKSPTSDSCLSCRFSPGHAEKLEQNYQKYYRHLMRCRDGFHYSKEKINAF